MFRTVGTVSLAVIIIRMQNVKEKATLVECCIVVVMQQ